MIHLKVWSGWLQPSRSRILLKDNGVWLVLYIVIEWIDIPDISGIPVFV
jgi:hypothetical protein